MMSTIKEGADKAFEKINKNWNKKWNEKSFIKRIFSTKTFYEVENSRSIFDLGFKDGYVFALEMVAKLQKGETKNLPVKWK